MTQVISTIVPSEQQNSQLLHTFPQHLISGLTRHELRAALAGQRHYQSHQHGTHATHEELCAFLKRKCKQWEYSCTSVEWQINFMGGWHAALLNDPTAEKERPTTPQAGPQGDDESWDMLKVADGDDDDVKLVASARPTFGGEDDDENNCFPQGEPDAPIVARATFGRDDDEEHHPIKAGEPTAPVLAGQGIAPQFFAPDDETEEAPIKCGEADAPVRIAGSVVFGPEDGDETGWSTKGGIVSLLFGPEGNDGGWGSPIRRMALNLMFAPCGGDEPGWPRLFDPKDDEEYGFASEGGDGPGWTLVFGPKDSGQSGWWITAPHEGNDDTWGDRCPSFGPEDEHGGGWKCIGEPLDAPIMARSWTRRPTFGPESDDEVGERCPSFGGEGEGDGEGFCLLPNCGPAVTGSRHSFIDDDDEDRCPPYDDEKGGWLCSRLPRYLKTRGGVSLLATPILPTEPPDADGDSLHVAPIGGGDETWYQARPSFIDEDEDEGKGYRSRLPQYAKSRGGASLLTMPSVPSVFSLPISMSLGGDGRRPLFDDEKPDDDGWHHPRPRSLTQQRYLPLLFGEDAEDDGHWDRSAVASLCGGVAWTM